MEFSEEWELWVEMADGGSEVRRRTHRQWISGAVDFYIFHIEGVPVDNHHFSKATHEWRTFYWIQTNPIRLFWSTTSHPQLYQSDTSHQSGFHLQPCINHRKKRPQIPLGAQFAFLEWLKSLTKSSQTTTGTITVHRFALYMHDIASEQCTSNNCPLLVGR